MNKPALMCLMVVSLFWSSAQLLAEQVDGSVGAGLLENRLAADVFAVVDGVEITAEELDVNVQSAKRQRFYHGKVEGEQLALLRAEVGQQLIETILFDAEAKRLKIKADATKVKARLKQVEQQYRGAEGWKRHRKVWLASLRDKLETEGRIAGLKLRVFTEAVAGTDAANEALVRAYYQANPDKFTTPGQLRLRLILLKVEPWAPAQSWQAALFEAQNLKRKLDGGADFAALARLHSSDASAADGGDLGLVHQGMLATEAQLHIEGLAVGRISEPLRLLRGVALFRIDEKVAPALNAYEQVVERARGLYQRDREQQAWDSLKKSLRAQAVIEMSVTKSNIPSPASGEGR